MDIKPIRTEEDYTTALAEIEALFEAESGTPENDKLEVLVTLVEEYEEKHYQIPLPNPIEAIEFHLERKGLIRKDLEPMIGSRARVSEILNCKRPLTLRMIRALHKELGISTEVLTQEYEVKNPHLDRDPFEFYAVNIWLSEKLIDMKETIFNSEGANNPILFNPGTPLIPKPTNFDLGTPINKSGNGYYLVKGIPAPNRPGAKHKGQFDKKTLINSADDFSTQRIIQ
jgi:HTH-type transcriptional regulator/antitoxin HigA